MKLTLIKPSMGDIIEDYGINKGRMEPLALGILAGLTPPEIDIVIYDDRMEAITFNEATDLVAITVDTFTAARAYWISNQYRQRGVPVILGGIHVTLLPDEAAAHADAVLTGDAETVWHEVIADAGKGRLKPRYSGGVHEFGRDVLPGRDLFRGKGYLPISLVQFSRGCRFNCSYCAVARFFKQNHYCRKISDVIREIREQNLKRILFVDDNIISDKKQLREFLKALMPLKIKWAAQASINLTDDPELMELMLKSGCVGHLIGFEAIGLDNLKWFNKSPNMHSFDKYQKAIGTLRAFGFQTWASFILGNDFDTPDTIRQTVDFTVENKFSLAFFHIFSPYPGTPLYARLRAEDRLLYNGRWWLAPEFRYNQAAFIPRNFTPQELERQVVWANRAFYSRKSILRRAFDFKTNLRSLEKFFLYIRFNDIMRKTSI